MKKLLLILFAAAILAASLFLLRSPSAARESAPQAAEPTLSPEEAQTPAPTAAEEPAPEPTPAPTPAPTPPADPLAAYGPVFDSYRRFLAGEESEGGGETERGDYYLLLGETGVSYLSRYGGTLGYCLMDLNGDEVPELLIGAEGGEYGGYLFDLFTLDGAAPKRVLAGSERVRYQLRSDGLIYFEGSGGASYGMWILYALDGDALRLTDGLIRRDEQMYELRADRPELFEKADGDIPLTEDVLQALIEAWRSRVTDFPLTPFL